MGALGSLSTLIRSTGPSKAVRGCQGLVEHGLSSVMSGMDNVRNMTGSPIAGIDPHEFLDVRPLNYGAPSAAALQLRRSLRAAKSTLWQDSCLLGLLLAVAWAAQSTEKSRSTTKRRRGDVL